MVKVSKPKDKWPSKDRNHNVLVGTVAVVGILVIYTFLGKGQSIPSGDDTLLKNLSETDKIRDNSKSGSGFGKNISNWLKRNMVYPTNVLQFATVCNNKNHSAAFPEELPEWFIKLFTQENDWVLDPFLGSGTTSEVAQRMRRNSIGIEIIPEYVEMAKAKIAQKEPSLLSHNRITV